MLVPKKGRWLVLTISLVAAFPTFAETSAALLDKIIREPGSWSQMCASPPPIPVEVPLPLYSLATPRHFSLSEENAARLQKRRAEVVPEIVQRLRKVDLSKPPKQKGGAFSMKDSNQDPNYLSGLMLEIILQLDAVESLPELLRLESDLDMRLKAAENGGSASLPILDLNSPVFVPRVEPASEPTAQQEQMFACRIFQRELLSVMTALLRKRRFQPLLDSELEKSYFEFLKNEAQSEELKDIKKLGDVPPKQRKWISFEPIHNLPLTRHWPQFTPYTPDLRSQIRQWVTDFLKLPPDARQLGVPPKAK